MSPPLQSFISAASERLFQGRRLVLLVLAFFLFSLLGVSWAVAMPIASAPDEPAHIIKAGGVARGDWFGERQVGEDGIQRDLFHVPEALAESSDISCNRFQPTMPTRDCPVSIDHPEGTLIPVESSAGGYNPIYYLLVGWPSLLHTGFTGIVLMRVVSALLVAAFFALAVWALSFLPHRRLPLLAGLAAFTPSVQGFAGAVNPQAAEIATLAAFTAALFTAIRIRARGGLLLTFAAIMAVSGAVGVQTRNLAWVWLGVIVLIALIYAGWGRFWRLIVRPPVLVAVIVVAAAIIANGLVIISRDSLTIGVPHWGAGWSFINAFLYMLRKAPEFFPSLLAVFGWADVSDAWAITLYTVASVLLVAGALLVKSPARHRAAVIAATLAMWLMPAVIQGVSMAQGGFIWQGRYHLPLYVLLVFAAAICLADRVPGWDQPQVNRVARAFVAGFAFVQITSFGWALYRQYLGIGQAPATLFATPAEGPFASAPVLGTLGWALTFVVVAFAWWLLASMLTAPARDRQLEPSR